MEIVHHYVNRCFDWLISGQQSVNPWREAISILSGKYIRFSSVHPVVPILDNLFELCQFMQTVIPHENHVEGFS